MNDSSFLSKPGVKNGIAYGVVMSIIWLVLYFINWELLYAQWKSIITVIVMIFFIVGAMRAKRQKAGGYIKYGDAMPAGLATALFGAIVLMLTACLLHFVIDPDLAENSKALTLERMEEMSGMFGGGSGDAIENVMEQMEEQDLGINATNLFGFLINYLICGLIIALIAAAFIKRDPPPFEEEGPSVSDLAP